MTLRTILEPFLGPMSDATIAFPILASVSALPFALYHYRRHGHVHPWRAIVSYSFVYYLIAALFLVLLPLPELPSGAAGLEAWNESYGKLRAPQLDPTAFIREILYARTAAWRLRSIFQAVLNVLLLLPFGAYLVYAFKRRPFASALWGLALSLTFELCQLTGIFWIYPGPYRLFDTGDILCNAAGALAGAYIAALLLRLRVLPDLDALPGPERPWIGPLRRGIALAMDAAAVGLSYLCATWILGRAGALSALTERIAFVALSLAWLVILPALDGGKGFGKRIVLCSIARANGRKAGSLLVLARQSIAWAPPLLLVLGSSYLPPGRAWSALLGLASGVWTALWLLNALQSTFSREHAGWLDRRLKTRVRNAWKPIRGAQRGNRRAV
jgi:glycopeptide antibiotics resistance protein